MPVDFLDKTFLGNTVARFISAGGIFVVGIVAVKIVRKIVVARIEKAAARTANIFDDFVVGLFVGNVLPLLYFGCFYAAGKFLEIPPALSKALEILGVAVLTVFTVRVITAVVSFLLHYYLVKKQAQSKEGGIKGLITTVKIIVWSAAIIFFLDNVGFKVSTVLAGLGIGGVAIALASQTILGDLFSYFAIFFDRPFEVGDFIIIGDFMGVVEYIGVKTTRIRSLGGEEIVFSNKDLTNSRVRNYKRMARRRVVFKIGVVYETPVEKLKEIPVIIENIIRGIEGATFDRAHFVSFGDFSLDFEIVYYVESGDYNKYMDIQQKINFTIKQEFENRKIEFAYPATS